MSLRVVFMGTPSCAEPSFRRLLADGHELMGVCQPDRAKGRGRQVCAPPVKRCASDSGVPFIQPASVNAPEAHEALRAFEPDIFAVVAFGQILKPETLAIPRLKPVNLHFSLLPRWRGAAPVQYAIWAGDAISGVTVQYMEVGLDEGDVLLQEETPIGPEETAGELMARMADAGADLLSRALTLIEAGQARPIPQDSSAVTWARALRPEQGRLDWTQPAAALVNHIRAFNPAPGAFTAFAGEPLKVWRAVGVDREGEPGVVLGVEDDLLVVACGEGAVGLRELQPAGRGRQSGRDFANGRRIAPGVRVDSPEGAASDAP